MEWTKVFIQTTTFGTEIVMGVLLSLGVLGVEIVDPRERANYLEGITRTWDYVDESLMESGNNKDEATVIFYVTTDEHGLTLINKIFDKLELVRSDFEHESNTLESLIIKTESTDDDNWLHEWKKHFKPFDIGNVVIVPEWEEYEQTGDEIIFKIDPGTAFGTGQHETTKLCVLSLQEYVKPNDSILDIGCGSGILSCVSLLLGAKLAFACDIDPAGAISATKRNANLNGIECVSNEINAKGLVLQAGDILSDKVLLNQIKQRKYDVVVANIVADVIIELLPLLPELLKPNGYFISSGIIDERLDDVIKSFTDNGVAIEDTILLDSWCCVVGRNKNA